MAFTFDDNWFIVMNHSEFDVRDPRLWGRWSQRETAWPFRRQSKNVDLYWQSLTTTPRPRDLELVPPTSPVYAQALFELMNRPAIRGPVDCRLAGCEI